VLHDRLPKVCEVPTVIASCPTAAISPVRKEGRETVQVAEDLCMFCGNCYTVVPGDAAQRPAQDGVSIWGGRQGEQRAIRAGLLEARDPFLPNNPPRWPEVVEA